MIFETEIIIHDFVSLFLSRPTNVRALSLFDILTIKHSKTLSSGNIIIFLDSIIQ